MVTTAGRALRPRLHPLLHVGDVAAVAAALHSREVGVGGGGQQYLAPDKQTPHHLVADRAPAGGTAALHTTVAPRKYWLCTEA